MTTDSIQDLVKRLRAIDHTSVEDCFLQSPYFHKAADALEAMEGEVERLTINGIHSCWEECPRLPCVQGREIRALTAERDRLAGEVERLKEERDAARDDEELMSKAKQLCEAERDRTRADYEAMKAHNKELFGKLSAAELERDRLKAALQPFSDAYERLVRQQESMGFSDNATFGLGIKVSAIKAARKALGGDA